MPRCLVSIGSNLGDRGAAISQAVVGLGETVQVGALRVSEPVVSTPVGGPAGQQPFFNAAAVFDTKERPETVLARLQHLELSAGRSRDVRWDARPLDLDLLLYGEEVIRTPELRVPHPRMTFRPFVLGPACEVAGEMAHPECGETLSDLLARLESGRDAVVVANDARGEVAGLIAEFRPDIPVETSADSGPPRLTVDARSTAGALAPCGPRLALADCPREHWREEVLAALECVWPTPTRDDP